VATRDPIDEAARAAAIARIRAEVAEHWKNAVGLLALNVFAGILFYTERDTYWVQVTLAMFGLFASVLWACINIPPRNFPCEDGSKIAVEQHMMRPWFMAVLALTANLALALMLMFGWVYVIVVYLAPVAISSLTSFGIFVLGLGLLACTWRIYPKATRTECSIMLECDHLLREAALNSKEGVQRIDCPPTLVDCVGSKKEM
jgi:hypothetical protein